MATKIGGDQLRLEDFIKNPTPNGDWSSTLFTASLAAIKSLVSASGIPELSGTVRLWEIDPGIYFLHGGTTIYPGRNRVTTEQYDSILILSDFFQRYNYKYYIIYNTIGQITYGQARETGGSAIFSKITPFQGASGQYQGSVGTVPAPQAGDNEKFLKGDGTWGEPDVFDGATSSAAGGKGIVPAPQAGDNEKFLKGDGTWGREDVFEGATFSTSGKKGLVPAPIIGAERKYLNCNGSWQKPFARFVVVVFASTYKISASDTIEYIRNEALYAELQIGTKFISLNKKISGTPGTEDVEFLGIDIENGQCSAIRLYCVDYMATSQNWRIDTIPLNQ